MAPSEHITWFEDNVEWFENIDLDRYDTSVPACPGWDVEYVVNHLSFGLGLAYPAAMAKDPETEADVVFAEVDWPSAHPTGADSLAAFTTNMRACAAQFRAADPATPCWTYAGPGRASFWFRRAAVETTLHRMDVAEALSVDQRHLDDRCARDAIEETLEFALPLASDMTKRPSGRIKVVSPCLNQSLVVGNGDRTADVAGESHAVLAALWGRNAARNNGDVTVSGDLDVADEWLRLVTEAFSGR